MMWCQLGLTVGTMWSMTHSVILTLVGQSKKKKKKTVKPPLFSVLFLRGRKKLGRGELLEISQISITLATAFSFIVPPSSELDRITTSYYLVCDCKLYYDFAI